MEKFKTKDETVPYPGRYGSPYVTIADLQEFQKRLVNDILSAIQLRQPPTKKWLKSHEVRRMFKISPGTLQNLKNNGVIPYTKLGGVHFYDHEAIQRLLESGMFRNE